MRDSIGVMHMSLDLSGFECKTEWIRLRVRCRP